MTNRIHPILLYARAREAMAFLERAFGFHIKNVYDGPNDTVAHGELTFGTGTVGLSSAGPVDPANVWTTVRQGVYVALTDVDAHHAKAEAAGARIERALQDTSYGSREYTARDAGGHLWSFGTYAMNDEGGPAVFIPELRYDDGRAAIEFLTRAFGFAPGLEVTGADGQIAHAELWLDDEVLMVTSGSGGADLWQDRRQCTYVRLADPDAHFARARAAGAIVVQEPKDTSYGARGYLVEDSEGFLWGFGTYAPTRPSRPR